MNRKITLIILVIISLLAILACDRFDKPTANDEETPDYQTIVNEFFNNFQVVADTISADNVEYFMEFFHPEYLYNGLTKADIQDMINSIFMVNEPRFIQVIMIDHNQLNVEWKIRVTTLNDVFVEEHIFADVMLKDGDNYYLYGNQVEPVEEDKLMVFAEIMTATWCGTCPQVEEAMHEYQTSNPQQFFYLEYHVMDSIAGEHDFFDNFYGFTNPPVAVIQGVDSFIGDQSSTYPAILDNYKDMDAQLKLSNLSQVAGSENYQASLDIEKLTSQDFDTSNLKLRWAFYEEVSPVNNYEGQPCRHVVLTEGYFDITSEDLNTSFSINLDYPREIPDDLGIVFWLQTANDSHDDNSFIHAWIKEDLGSK